MLVLVLQRLQVDITSIDDFEKGLEYSSVPDFPDLVCYVVRNLEREMRCHVPLTVDEIDRAVWRSAWRDLCSTSILVLWDRNRIIPTPIKSEDPTVGQGTSSNEISNSIRPPAIPAPPSHITTEGQCWIQKSLEVPKSNSDMIKKQKEIIDVKLQHLGTVKVEITKAEPQDDVRSENPGTWWAGTSIPALRIIQVVPVLVAFLAGVYLSVDQMR